MQCTKCKSEIPQGNVNCNFCGEPIKKPTAQIINQTIEDLNKKPTSTKKKSPLASIVTIIVFLAIAGYGAYSNVGKDRNDDALRVLEQSNNYEEAILGFQSALENIDNDTDKIEVLKNIAYAYLGAENYDQAKNKFNEALTLTSPNSFNYYLISGEIALLENDPEKALEDYFKAVDLAPDDFQINSTIGVFYLGLDEVTAPYTNFTKALEYNQTAYDGNKDSETMKENLALNHFFLGNYQEALDLLLVTSLENKPSNQYLVGLCYYNLYQDEKAREHFLDSQAAGFVLEPEIEAFLANQNGDSAQEVE